MNAEVILILIGCWPGSCGRLLHTPSPEFTPPLLLLSLPYYHTSPSTPTTGTAKARGGYFGIIGGGGGLQRHGRKFGMGEALFRATAFWASSRSTRSHSDQEHRPPYMKKPQSRTGKIHIKRYGKAS